MTGQTSDNHPDIPLASVEDRGSPSPSDLPRFDFPPHGTPSIPPRRPVHLQSSTSLAAVDYPSSAASSPSAAYAGLSIEGERGGDPSSDRRRGSLASTDQDTQSQLPLVPFAHRVIMGGAADLPLRSSSPLKRRASNLEGEAQPSQREDVDMLAVPELASLGSTVTAESRQHPGRTPSVQMLAEENNIKADPTSENRAMTDVPPIDVQIATVTTLCEAAAEKQLEEGDTAYLVSKRWLERVISRGSEARQKSKTEPEGEVGPVDNSDIIERIFTDSARKEFVQLKDGVGMESFQMFPEDAWNMVVDWYGLMPGQIPIIRIAHNTNPDKTGEPNMQYELHPPIFVIHRLWSDIANLLDVPLKVKQPDAPVLVLSRTVKYVDFLKQIKIAAGVDLTRKIRIWRVPRLQPAAEPAAPEVHTMTPPLSPPNSDSGNTSGLRETWPKLLVDVESFTKLPRGEGRELVDIPDYSANKNYNGHSDIAFSGLGESQAVVIEECVQGSEYVSNYNPRASQNSTGATKSTALVSQSLSQTNSGRNSPAPSGPMTRGRTQRNGRTPGTVGLSNLGNTCYMNSALQCIRSVKELTQYFLSGAALQEVNKHNPLGSGGDIAQAYYQLLTEIYNTKNGSVAPRHFKQTISRHAPQFSGYGQQDSQEFLGFLLDGLQEDLSRVKKKPYIEKPDSTDEMVNDPEAIREMAAKVWDITKKRDDSVVADLFTGMYKSTLVCPVCAKVSMQFDPFNSLTLQLPIENSWSHAVYFFPLNNKPIMINVDIDKQATILSMKHYLCKKTGVPVERLFVAEEFKAKFYKIFNDTDIASEEIGTNDCIAVYELEAKPTNWPSTNNEKPKKSKVHNFDGDEIPNWDSPMAERMLVPVFYRRPNTERTRFGNKKPWELSPVPHYIIVTPEEARSEDLIKRKILEKLATFTTHSLFEDEEEIESAADSLDPYIVHTTSSDSSGNSKVVANSIDGEDELVDVTMKDTGGIRETAEKDSITSLADSGKAPNFNRRRPKFVTPGSYLEPELQNMFELCYFVGKELVPVGWNFVDDDKNYPKLSSRNPQLSQAPDESEDDLANERSASGSSNEDGSANYRPYSITTRMAEEDESDEDEISALPPPRVLPVRPAGPKSGVRVGHRRRQRGIQTYSKKGSQLARKLSQTRDFDQDAPDDGPLIRLGEGIVVDWNQEAFSTMFEGTSPDDSFRGQSTWTSIPTYDDPELTKKRNARAQRRKNGITLDDCLDEFGREEILSEMDTWYCPRCKEHRRAAKKLELWKTPDILIMHLKRFSSAGYRRDKLDVLVDFPIENLDLTSRVIETEEGKSEIYDLFAVDDHWGGLGGGHYTAFAKNFEDQKWYEYNDSSVSEVKDVKRIVSASAYLLFYRRRSEGLLGGPRFLEILTQNEKAETSEDDEVDSGEGQGLDAESSLRGSSSALTGVGAALHQISGSGTEMGQKTTVNPRDLDALPAYQAHETEEDSAPLLLSDAQENEGLGLQQSVEEDEGIDMGTGYNTMNLSSPGDDDFNSDNINPNPILGLGQESWTFDGLTSLNLDNGQYSNKISGNCSEIDCDDNSGFEDRSDIVQHDSSPSESSRRGRLEEFDNAIATNEDGDVWEDPSPVPDVEDENQLDTLTLHRELLQTHRGPPEFQVHAPAEDEEVDQPATEIHIEPSEELKID